MHKLMLHICISVCVYIHMYVQALKLSLPCLEIPLLSEIPVCPVFEIPVRTSSQGRVFTRVSS